MRFKQMSLRIVMLFSLSLLGVGSGLAQDATPEPLPTATATTLPVIVTPSPKYDVAIIIVDVFDENKDAKPIPQEKLNKDDSDPNNPNQDMAEKDCAISTVGQDGLIYRGNATSSLFPFAYRHGNLVLQNLRNTILQLFSGQVTPPTEFVHTDDNSPNAELWSTPVGNIWLVGVDTQEYNIGKIKKRVENAVSIMKSIPNPVTHYVINMSFGLVPCDQMPKLEITDYINQLAAWGIKPPFDNSELGTIGKSLVDLDTKIQNNTSLDPLADLIAIQSVSPNAFAFLHLAVMQPKIQAALSILAVPNDNAIPFHMLPSGNNELSIVQVASAGNDGLPYPYYPAMAPNVLSVSAAYSPYDSVAACQVGSHVQLHAYLRHFGYPTVVVDQIIRYVLSPVSNSGEVIENGISTLEPNYYLKDHPVGTNADALGCLTGTSFAAPTMSLKLAIDQTVRDDSICKDGGTGTKLSDPPLAHPNKWDNLDFPTAIGKYCPDFYAP